MIKHRRGMAALVVLAGGFVGGELPAEAPNQPPGMVGKLTSDVHRVREQALAELVREGAGAVPALINASLSKDPELSWRALEALQVVCQTVDLKAEASVKAAIFKHSRSTNKAEAAVAQKLLQQWPVLRHSYAVAQLEALGAEVADYPPEQLVPAPAAGGVFPGGVFGGMLMPVDFEGDVVVEAEVVAEDVAAEGEAIADAIEEAAEAPAEPAEKKPLFGGIFRAIARAAGEIKEADEAVGEALGERLADEIEERLERRDDAIEADVEILEEAPAAMPADFGMEGFAVLDGGMFIGRGGAMMWHSHAAAVPTESNELQPGTLRIGKQWRGGDGGLEYVAGLQQMHTVILREAPLTDAALAQLRKLRSLSQLRVIDGQLSSAALLKFRQQRPEVTIHAVGPAVLGVAGQDHPQGLLVQMVTPETGARRAGIDEQDIITKVAGHKVRSLNDIVLALYDKRPGDKVQVDYLRGGKTRTADISLTAREHAPVEAQAATYHSHSVQTLEATTLIDSFILPE